MLMQAAGMSALVFDWLCEEINTLTIIAIPIFCQAVEIARDQVSVNLTPHSSWCS
ncbi:MAG: hypothetical protein ABW085_01745 [Sedimenticola sp.]